ncbi:MAG: CDP-alcohol phosphatidyltransferase family protein [Chloroflexi bacterium]|nr:CDP-alcohol phosphatidyltransferase family protein [Chloroflexota bacterium]
MSERITESKSQISLTELARKKFGWIFIQPAAFLNRIGLMPNTVTILGLVGNTIGAVLLANGQIILGGIVILLMGPIDALDGAMARLRGEPTEFGAFVDSVTDRYSELVIFGGLIYYYLQQGDWLYVILAYLAAAGSVLVSYVRARAQSLGHETKVGILTRMERYLVLVPGLIFNIPKVSLWIIAILANLTALQRIWDVRRKAHKL